MEELIEDRTKKQFAEINDICDPVFAVTFDLKDSWLAEVIESTTHQWANREYNLARQSQLPGFENGQRPSDRPLFEDIGRAIITGLNKKMEVARSA